MKVRIQSVDVTYVTPQAVVIPLPGGGKYTIPVEDASWWGARIGKIVELSVSDG